MSTSEVQDFRLRYRADPTHAILVSCDSIVAEFGMLWFFRADQVVYLANVDAVQSLELVEHPEG